MDWSEINAAITEKVEQATADLEGDERTAAKKQALDNLPQGVRQFLWNGGHKTATAQNDEKVKALEDEKAAIEKARDEARQALEDAQARVEELKAETPDVEAIEKRYQAEIRKQEEKITELNEGHAEAVAGLQSQLQERDKGDFRSKVLVKAAARLDSDYADVQLQKMEARGRIQTKESGGVQVLQPGKEIPYMAETTDALAETVAQEIIEGADEKWIRSNADRGGGSSQRTQGGKPSPGKYERVRKEARARAEKRNGSSKSLSERLGMTA